MQFSTSFSFLLTLSAAVAQTVNYITEPAFGQVYNLSSTLDHPTQDPFTISWNPAHISIPRVNLILRQGNIHNLNTVGFIAHDIPNTGNHFWDTAPFIGREGNWARVVTGTDYSIEIVPSSPEGTFTAADVNYSPFFTIVVNENRFSDRWGSRYLDHKENMELIVTSSFTSVHTVNSDQPTDAAVSTQSILTGVTHSTATHSGASMHTASGSVLPSGSDMAAATSTTVTVGSATHTGSGAASTLTKAKTSAKSGSATGSSTHSGTKTIATAPPLATETSGAERVATIAALVLVQFAVVLLA